MIQTDGIDTIANPGGAGTDPAPVEETPASASDLAITATADLLAEVAQRFSRLEARVSDLADDLEAVKAPDAPSREDIEYMVESAVESGIESELSYGYRLEDAVSSALADVVPDGLADLDVTAIQDAVRRVEDHLAD